jgi:glutamyl/glutaminyl-tRNA synthetase
MQEVEPNSCYIGRYAPTPSGWLHKGHMATFSEARKRAIAHSGRILLRMEDIDPDRCKPEFEAGVLEDLEWLGLEWDLDPRSSKGWVKQSDQIDVYRNILQSLVSEGHVYPCSRSRKEIREYPGLRYSKEGAPLFPNAWRSQWGDDISAIDFNRNWRFRVRDEATVSFCDGRLGQLHYRAGIDFGDFLVWSKTGFPSYELAVVVDDYLSKITEVVRGEDLLVSTARQLLIYESLGWSAPSFFHCPLVCDSDGKRLGKRYDSLSIRQLRNEGLSPGQILEA